MGDRVDSFVAVGDGVGAGTPVPDGWRRVSECECLVLVGLTGVGKSTVLGELTGALGDVTVLPDRRTLTDVLMIPTVQRVDGLAVEPVADRAVRFELTRRYRQIHAGGMAHALSTVSVSPETAERFVIFDGLRGANEVRHAGALDAGGALSYVGCAGRCAHPATGFAGRCVRPRGRAGRGDAV